VSFTDRLLNTFGSQVKELILVPDRGGKFEVTVNGQLIYSKLETGEFPDEAQLMKQIENL
jgi:selenoprotein W-related protein